MLLDWLRRQLFPPVLSHSTRMALWGLTFAIGITVNNNNLYKKKKNVNVR